MDKASHAYWSMRSGIATPADNRRSYSDFSQDVDLPDLPSLTLSFQRWPQGATAAGVQAAALADLQSVQTEEQFYRALEAAGGDLQYVMVIAPPGGTLRFVYAGLADNRAWVGEQIDLSAYRGQRVRIQFGTYNDGQGPTAVQYFDDMSLRACSGPRRLASGCRSFATRRLARSRPRRQNVLRRPEGPSIVILAPHNSRFRSGVS